jgi:multidrug resistance efflux pump
MAAASLCGRCRRAGSHCHCRWCSCLVAAYPQFRIAFIDTRVVPISAQISAAIVDVPITDNQLVDAGGVLVRLGDRDYAAALVQAKAQVEQAQGTIANLDAQIAAQKARIAQAQQQVSGAQAALTFAQQENARAQDLFKKGAGTAQAAQQTSSNLRQAQAALDAAQASAGPRSSSPRKARSRSTRSTRRSAPSTGSSSSRRRYWPISTCSRATGDRDRLPAAKGGAVAVGAGDALSGRPDDK